MRQASHHNSRLVVCREDDTLAFDAGLPEISLIREWRSPPRIIWILCELLEPPHHSFLNIPAESIQIAPARSESTTLNLTVRGSAGIPRW